MRGEIRDCEGALSPERLQKLAGYVSTPTSINMTADPVVQAAPASLHAICRKWYTYIYASGNRAA
jgi:hypothetical protein